MVINGKKYKDLVLTMEVIQAPRNLDYHQLEDPKEARKKAAEKKKVGKGCVQNVTSFGGSVRIPIFTSGPVKRHPGGLVEAAILST